MQGCVLSPLLFNIYLNSAVQQINTNGLPGIPLGIDALQSNFQLNILLYADDIVLTASSPADLQTLMDALNMQMRKWGLQINTDPVELKTSIVVFPRHRQQFNPITLYIGSDPIHEINSYTYLGVIFSNNLLWNDAVHHRLACAANKATILPRLRYKQGWCPIKLAEEIYFACVRPALDFCCEIWDTDLSNSTSTDIENFHINIGRDFLQASSSSQAITIRGELGWTLMSERFDNLRLRFWQKCATLAPQRETNNKQPSEVYPQPRYLLHATYLWSKRVNSAWWIKTRRILDECELQDYYSPSSVQTDEASRLLHIYEWTPIVQEAVQTRSMNRWKLDLANLEHTVKLETYIRIKTTLKRERYLDEVSDNNMRRFLFQLRTGTCSNLLTEGARTSNLYNYIPRHERTCRSCPAAPGSSTPLDDSLHFLTECPAFNHLRSNLLHALQSEHATLIALPSSSTTMSILDMARNVAIHDTLLGGPITDELTNAQYHSLMFITKQYLFHSFALKREIEPQLEKKQIKNKKLRTRWKNILRWKYATRRSNN